LLIKPNLKDSSVYRYNEVLLMKKLIISLCIVCTVLTVIACGTPGSALERNKWSLNSYGEQNNPEQVLEGTEITATFDKGKGEVSGSSGCNTYFASYEVKGNSLSIYNLAYTERACISPTGVMEQEQEFLSLLADAESFQVDDTSLTITCSSGRQLYFKIISQ
jgi:heat shock protein HslJ